MALVVVASGACGYEEEPEVAPAEPVIIEPGPSEPPVPLDVEVPLEESGFFRWGVWPAACDLLTDEEITTVLPQATVADRVSGDQEFVIMGYGASGGHRTAKDSTCTIGLDIPQAGLPAGRPVPGSDTESETPEIHITIDAAGSPAVLQMNFMVRNMEPLETTSGECFVDGSVTCRKDPLVFTISSGFPLQQYDDDDRTWTNRYRVDGETTTFSAEILDDDAEARREREFRDLALNPRLAELALAKI